MRLDRLRLTRIAAGIATLAAPATALADPVSATAFLVSAASASAGYWTAALVAGSIGLTTYGAARARSKARAAAAKERRRYNASLQDRSITALQATPPLRIIYGRTITGGDVHAIFTSDKTGTRNDGTTYTKRDALRHLVIAIADHECEAIHEVYIDGIAVGALDGSGQPTSGTFAPARKITRELTIAAGASSVQPAAVTVLTCWDESLSAGQSPDSTGLVTGTYSLSAGDTTITNTGSNAIRITFTYSLVSPTVRVEKMLGTAGQTVNAYLNGLVPTKWTSNHRLRGICYAVVTLDLEEQRFQGGPPNFTFDVSGKKVYDPRTATTAWSQNPALCTRDFLFGEYGYQVGAADVDDAYTTAAANACEVRRLAATHSHAATFTADAAGDTITFASDRWLGVGDGVRFTTTGTLPAPLAAGTTYYVIAGASRTAFRLATSRANALAGSAIDITSAGSGTHTGTWYDYDTYTCNGAFTTAQPRESVLEELLETMAGTAVYGAKWQVMAGAWSSPVMDLGDDDLHGQIEIVQGDVGMDQLVNGVRGQYIQRGKATATDFDSYQNATFLAADGVALWDDLELSFVDNKARARNLARIRVESARAGQIIRFPAKLRAWPLQVGDRVRVTSAEYGWSLKTYRVTDWQFSTASAVVLTLQEDASTIWDLADAATADPTPNSGLADPWAVASLSGFTHTSGSANQVRREDGTLLTRVRLAWTAITDPYVADGTGRVLIEWRRQYWDPANVWRSEPPVVGTDNEAWISGVSVGNVLTIRVTVINGLGARSEPIVVSHTVTGAVALTAGANLLANSSFESDPNGDGLAASWVRSSSGSVGTLSAELNAPARHGSVSQRIVSSALASGGAYHHIYQDVALPEDVGGQPFTLAVDSRVGTGTIGRLEMSFYDASSTLLSTSGKDFPSSNGNVWNRLRVVFIAPATTERIRVRLMQTGGSGAAAAARFDKAFLALGDVNTEWSPKPEELLPDVTTKVTLDEYDFAGATYTGGATARRTVVVTPARDCTIEFTAQVYCMTVESEAGNRLYWRVTPSGGSVIALGNVRRASTTVATIGTAVKSFKATAGVALTFELVTQVPSGNPGITLWESDMRITEVRF